MKKILLAFSLLFIAGLAQSQNKYPDLLGVCTTDQLLKEPYAGWYTGNLSGYRPNAEVLAQLKKTGLSKYSMKIFFGSWCGDSKRELPKMIKVLDQLSFNKNDVVLIGVDDSVKTYKQSPQREEAGLNIYRVPTFIIYKGEKEIGRIIESPAETMERDLLKIFSKEEYAPNYHSYSIINQWLKDGILKDENINARGLAFQLKPVVLSESELNSCGYVLMAQASLAEAIAVFRININLFPQSANCFDSLGEVYATAGFKDKAIQAYEVAAQLDPKNESISEKLKELKGEQ
jgi:thiol-disulfide isomerase/thioredoxin